MIKNNGKNQSSKLDENIYTLYVGTLHCILFSLSIKMAYLRVYVYIGCVYMYM